jgi:hypothetical protein
MSTCNTCSNLPEGNNPSLVGVGPNGDGSGMALPPNSIGGSFNPTTLPAVVLPPYASLPSAPLTGGGVVPITGTTNGTGGGTGGGAGGNGGTGGTGTPGSACPSCVSDLGEHHVEH